MILPGAFWSGIDSVLWSAGAGACVLGAAWLHGRRYRFGDAGPALLAALIATGGWALAGALLGLASAATALAESLRNLAWIFVLYRLFAVDGRDASMKPVRPMLVVLACVELMLIVVHVALAARSTIGSSGTAFDAIGTMRLLGAIGGLVLAHNLFGGASQQARRLIRWPAAAMAILWIVDLNHYVIGYLSGSTPAVIAALRGFVALPAAGLIALGAGDRGAELRFRPSRAVTFQSISLLLIGGYLLLMMAASQWLALTGTRFSELLQIGLVALVAMALLTVTFSPRLRGWLRVMALKHLFQHRYDYRAEWLRFAQTISRDGPDSLPLRERVIRAVADIADSPCGLLLVPGDGGDLELAARWNWSTVDVPAVAMTALQARRFERDGHIADLDALRSTEASDIDLADWLRADPRIWALVPLLHFDRLAGLVVLAQPAHPRRLDWEDFDMLRVVGRQLASYLTEQATQEALAEAGQFDEFHRRIAFVMHDIKNLASQLGLLARNAEIHAENADFRADMLVTLRNSTDKLNALVARLSRYRSPAIEELETVRADAVASAVVGRLGANHPVVLVEDVKCEVAANRESLEQVLVHLVQNGLDASPAGSSVFVSVTSDGLNGKIEVVDSGTGMSAEFVRARLFRPFDSTKQGGFGIGAYEARELVRAMRGRLEVESREGLGTRCSVILPLAETAALLETMNGAGNAGAEVG